VNNVAALMRLAKPSAATSLSGERSKSPGTMSKDRIVDEVQSRLDSSHADE
jgi:hypothetical protein